MTRSLARVFALDPGFAPENAVAVQLFAFDPSFAPRPEEWRQLARGIEAEVAALPGVTAVGIVNALPLSPVQGGTALLEVEGRAAPEVVRVGYRVITPRALAALGRRLVAGRPFTADDRAGGAPVVMLSEAAARTHFAGSSPLGQHVRMAGGNDPWAEVVGLVADVRSIGLERAPEPEILFPYEQEPTGALSVVARAAGPSHGLLEAVQAAIGRADPRQAVYRAMPLAELVKDSTARRRFLTTALGLFAGLALVLAAVGLYGVITFAMRSRLTEIAVRMALGATPAEIRRLVLREGAQLTGLGLGLGLALGLVGAKAAAALLFEIPPTDPMTFLGVSLLLAAVAGAACLLPARRAASQAPFTLLRQE